MAITERKTESIHPGEAASVRQRLSRSTGPAPRPGSLLKREVERKETSSVCGSASASCLSQDDAGRKGRDFGELQNRACTGARAQCGAERTFLGAGAQERAGHRWLAFCSGKSPSQNSPCLPASTQCQPSPGLPGIWGPRWAERWRPDGQSCLSTAT